MLEETIYIQQPERFLEKVRKGCVFWRSHCMAWNGVQDSGTRDLMTSFERSNYDRCVYILKREKETNNLYCSCS